MAATVRPHRTDTSRRDLTDPWRHLDVVLIVCTVAIAVLGTIMVFSATRKGSTGDTFYLKRQAGFVAAGVLCMLAITLPDYRRLREVVWFIYGVVVLLLLLVISPLGSTSKGAQAWFAVAGFQMQPAEFAKIGLIITLGALLARWDGDIDLRRLLLVGTVAAVPMLLILKQPDLGTALVFVAIVMAQLLLGGVKARYLLALAVVGVLGVTLVLRSDMLAQYQKDRLTAFVDPGKDTRGSTYNVTQSQLAIGAGGVSGRGLFNGPQTQLGFVPEQQTDFIFTVVGEELGFVGGAVLLALYAIVIWRIWRAAQLARDRFGSLLCGGVLAMLVFQVFESVGMTMGIMPVTGIPLPFLSYGGSSVVASFIGIGLVLNVNMRRFR